jgi:predicted amidohydrolase YtcJ
MLPGLVDHHLHLLAWAAARCSISCGPPDVTEEEALRAALGRAPGSGWIRGVGYHESVAGTLDRRRLDALAPGRPVRVQHRTGACWMLSSAAMQALAVDTEPEREGIERGADGRPTGRLFRMDAWLGERLRGASDEGPPDLTACGQELSTRGVVDVTDATPTAGAAEVAHFARARQSGALPQRLHLLGSPTACAAPGVAVLGRKLVIDEWALPLPDALADRIREAHSVGSPVAIHAVTRAELAVAAAALEEAGVVPGDRIEHAAVAPPDIVAWLAALGVAVVIEPGFVQARGDAYLRDVDAADRPWLVRARGFDDASVALAAGTDAPYGPADPWLAMQAAVDRRTRAGALLGESEAVTPERALALFTTPPHAPGGPPRSVVAGAPADLCLLALPWSRARDRLAAADVVGTWVGGWRIHGGADG